MAVPVSSEAHIDAVGVTSTIGSLALLLGLGGALGVLVANTVAFPADRAATGPPPG